MIARIMITKPAGRYGQGAAPTYYLDDRGRPMRYRTLAEAEAQISRLMARPTYLALPPEQRPIYEAVCPH